MTAPSKEALAAASDLANEDTRRYGTRNWHDPNVFGRLIDRHFQGLRDERDLLREATTNLVSKLDECKDHINGAFMMAYHIRGGKYTGPNYREELKQAEAALASKADA